MSMKEDTKRFIKIAITLPDYFPGEIGKINDMLKSGQFDFVHIRKPDYDISQMRDLLKGIKLTLLSQIKIHSHFSLIDEFPGIGVHLNCRWSEIPENAISISKSIHSIEEISESDCYNYVTLSPIFDSISKPGYESAFILSEIKESISGKNIIALGGVTEEKIPLLKATGFYGCAMLGAAWQD